MTCEQCSHRNVCHKEHLATDLYPEHFYYSDLDNVEDACDHFVNELTVKEFPCYVGQKLWMLKDVIQNNVNTCIIEAVYVISIRYRNALASYVIDSQNTEEKMQIFVGPEDSYQLIELSDKDFGKKLFYNETEAQKYLEETYGKEN